MFVSLKRNQNGSYRTRINDVLFMLDAGRNRAEVDHGPILETDVMLVRALFTQLADGTGVDYTQDPYGYLVRPYEADDKLVRHPGFECSGSMCQTTSSVKIDGKSLLLTPGRLHGAGFYVSENNNADFHKSPRMPLIPGMVFVKSTTNSVVRAEGVPEFEDTAAYIKQHNPLYQQWLVDQTAWEVARAERIALMRAQHDVKMGVA